MCIILDFRYPMMLLSCGATIITATYATSPILLNVCARAATGYTIMCRIGVVRTTIFGCPLRILH